MQSPTNNLRKMKQTSKHTKTTNQATDYIRRIKQLGDNCTFELQTKQQIYKPNTTHHDIQKSTVQKLHMDARHSQLVKSDQITTTRT